MKTEIVHIVFSIIVLTLAAAAQELAPAFGGAKPPFLLMAALCATMRSEPPSPADKAEHRAPSHGWLFVAAAAGLFADALDALPLGCVTAFTMIACTAARFVREAASGIPPALAGLLVGVIVAPCQEAWLDLWLPAGAAAPTLVRFCASAIPASIAGAALFAAIPAIARHIGLDGDAAVERRSRA